MRTPPRSTLTYTLIPNTTLYRSSHRAGAKALHELARRLDLLDRDRRWGELEFHQPAQRQLPFALLVDGGGELGVIGRYIATHCMLELCHRVRSPGVFLATDAIGIAAADIEHRRIEDRKSTRPNSSH